MTDTEPQLTKNEMMAKFADITKLGISDQCKYFLREFVADFAGNFEEVLELSEEFKKYAPEGGKDEVRELDEHKAHLFLEKRGETATVRDLRDALREIDVDANGKVAFIEYCLYKYKKTLEQLFAEKPKSMQALIDALEEAIRAHEETVAKRLEVEDQIKSLEVVAGGSGVKAMKARVELDAIRARSQTGQNMAEVRASMMTRKAKKALDEGDPMAEEMKRVEAAKKAKEAEEAAARAESKRRLAEKAAFLNK